MLKSKNRHNFINMIFDQYGIPINNNLKLANDNDQFGWNPTLRTMQMMISSNQVEIHGKFHHDYKNHEKIFVKEDYHEPSVHLIPNHWTKLNDQAWPPNMPQIA